ncbi:hypothetical protein DUNSADRAFT_15859 [Dunaliella salina]|uniref:Secreted protein n=1 Tax=Dunaliella salina TaxID=3046 RepID=A0ABQ7G4S8_DUNSA|nr:hypothetical protein DUNSADRAFT_15859 [Dunaliella salina]|eukprot:KAF5829594.1 hypothetical protein DUNSADRAFT_15859 [Dunaliella salina]
MILWWSFFALLAYTSAAPNNNIVSSSGPAKLWNDIGDVGKGGACASDAEAFCKDQSPGDGRIAACLSKRNLDVKEGNAAGKNVNKKCQRELADFKIDRSSHINKDIPLARSCAEDAAKLCKEANDAVQPASVLSCLR